MIRALLDVNVLIALLDADHTLHEAASTWFAAHARHGWATCPITENGCLRVMSQPGYPNTLPVAVIAKRLAEARASRFHEFWPADVSLLDTATAHPSRIHGPRQVTDVYLLALAVRHSGRFVTFDAAVTRETASGAEARHLVVL